MFYNCEQHHINAVIRYLEISDLNIGLFGFISSYRVGYDTVFFLGNSNINKNSTKTMNTVPLKNN